MIPRIAILMETSLEVSRGILRGITRYVKSNAPWTLEFKSGGISEQRLPDEWRGDGIIARIPSKQEAMRIASNPAPKVILDPHTPFAAPGHPISHIPRITCDNDAIGRTAAKHLMSRGFTNFAYAGPSVSSMTNCYGAWLDEPNWAMGRRLGFIAELKRHGHDVNIYKGPKNHRMSANWNLETETAIQWLNSLPKPVAIFTPHDARARHMADACLIAGIAVPYSIAILGVNNDATLCETSLPPLSSIPLDSEHAGYMAAETLDRLMHGKKVPKIATYSPLSVFARDSTLPHQTDDPLVINALEEIRKSRGFNLRAGELAAKNGVSLKTLNTRFTASIDKSVGEVIRTTCLDGVYDLVTNTDIAFAEIASRCGQQSAAHLAFAFRRRFGKTMTDARCLARKQT